ncbi:hypothetical protein ECC02_009121 [Trypanosoma cruzi]|uniref:Uncharacterized protein n=1 Tax=Trypanosoma cruzi TaxID=5693 RepID=A0A7J6XUQ6_TRYCR|nr:hypothetical protein ECC02_009121 [Trypanosoma cruzi]
MHRTPHTTHDTHSNPRQQAHTHSPAATPTHRWKREKQTGAAHKAPPHAHTARAVRRVGTPHGGYAHTHEKVQRTKQHKSKVKTIKRIISAHRVNSFSTGSAANIHQKNNLFSTSLLSPPAHTISCRPGHHRSRGCTIDTKMPKIRVVVEARGATVTVGSGPLIPIISSYPRRCCRAGAAAIHPMVQYISSNTSNGSGGVAWRGWRMA